MPRKPVSTLDVEESSAADDFLSTLEEDDDTPVFLEGDEKVTEEDIARELGIELDEDIVLGEKPASVSSAPVVDPSPVKRGPGRPRKNPLPVADPGDVVGAPEDDILSEIISPAPAPEVDKTASLKAAYETGRLVSQIAKDVEELKRAQASATKASSDLTVKVNEVHESIMTDIAKVLAGFQKTLDTVVTIVTQVHQMVHAVPKAAPKEIAPEPSKEEPSAFVPVVNDYIEKEVRTIVTSIPKGSRPLPVNQLAEVITRKRFNGDLKAQTDVTHVLRTRLSDLGSVTQDDQFHRL